jgi:hypothetical protein
MAIDSLRNQYQSGKERKSLQEIRGCLVDPVRKPVQRWRILFSIMRRQSKRVTG